VPDLLFGLGLARGGSSPRSPRKAASRPSSSTPSTSRASTPRARPRPKSRSGTR